MDIGQMNATWQRIKFAYDLLSEEKNWTKGAYARDKDGLATLVSSPGATCFCALGALQKSNIHVSDPYGVIDEAIRDHFGRKIWLADINDNKGRQAVLDVFDLAMTKIVKKIEQEKNNAKI